MVFVDIKAWGAKDWVQESQESLRDLKNNFPMAPNQKKIYSDKHRVERQFEVWDMVYLRL